MYQQVRHSKYPLLLLLKCDYTSASQYTYLSQLGFVEPWPVCKFEVTLVSTQCIHGDLKEIDLKHKTQLLISLYKLLIQWGLYCIICT